MRDFAFDPDQPHQRDAVAAVVDLFAGQPRVSAAETPDLAREIGAVGNHLRLDGDLLARHLRSVQERHGLPVTDLGSTPGLDVDVEMETGTGKTYVYLRTILALAERHGLTKFVVLVPGVAVRETVLGSVRLLRRHLEALHPVPFEVSVYAGHSADRVRAFATSSTVQILVMTIDSLRGERAQRVVRQARDQLGGLRPIDHLRATRPVVIVDEPQNMESDLSRSALDDLDPLCTLRYSATHRRSRHVVYRLDPVAAHARGLVKHVVVAEVTRPGVEPPPYARLIGIRREPWRARLELVCRDREGDLVRRPATVARGRDLARATHNPAYAALGRVVDVGLADADGPAWVELSGYGVLRAGEVLGGADDTVLRAMIRETVREHLRKEAALAARGVKVLSLFFVDRVASYVTHDEHGDEVDGRFARWFDEIHREESAALGIPPVDPRTLRRAYFARTRVQGATTYVDSTERGHARDDDAYDLIMRDKARLLDEAEPVRFLFSHSALREGWDNPNVFGICVLREMGEPLERRQTIGRGLRLPVDQQGRRVHDPEVAELTVVAGETYGAFAGGLQQEYAAAGLGTARPVAPRGAGRRAVRVDGAGDDVSPVLAAAWRDVERRTSYRLEVDTEALVAEVVRALAAEPRDAAAVRVTRTGLWSGAGSVAEVPEEAPGEGSGAGAVAAVLDDLQAATGLTRATLATVLLDSGRLDELARSPYALVALVRRHVEAALAGSLAGGLRYDATPDGRFELRRLEGGPGEREALWAEVAMAAPAGDEAAERAFAALLAPGEDGRCALRLPTGFVVATPLGAYDAHAAVVRREAGRLRITLLEADVPGL